MSENLRLISWNVNGLRAVMRKGLMDFVGQEKADILCLQEIKADENSLDWQTKNLPNYQFSYFSSAKKKGYSGVAVYSKIKPMSVEQHIFADEKFDNEGRVLKLEFAWQDLLGNANPKNKQAGNTTITLFNVYFPNGKASAQRLQYKMDFYQAFLQIIKKMLAQGKSVIVCGDVNTAHQPIDLARPKANENISGFLPMERAWMDNFLRLGLIDSFRYLYPDAKDQYSWWSYRSGARERNVGWRIDYFFLSQNLAKHLQQTVVLPQVQGSDHCPVGVELNLSY